MTDALSSSALEYALRRVEDFARVNFVRPDEEANAAATRWLDHIGLDGPRLARLREWLDEVYDGEWDQAALVGVAIGLLVNHYNLGNA